MFVDKKTRVLMCCVWGSAVACVFGVDRPQVTNGSGARCVGRAADLRGRVVDTGGERPDVIIYWGTKDGGVNRSEWEKSEKLGRRKVGDFTTLAAPLKNRTVYYYRCCASNSAGVAWAPRSSRFKVAAGGYSPSEVDAIDKRFSREYLEDMKTFCKSEIEYNGVVDEERRSQSGVSIDTWEDWVKEYNVIIPEEPIVFNIHENVPEAPTNLIGALHINLYALATKNVDLLYKYADSSEKKELKSRMLTKENSKSRFPWLIYGKRSPKITILCVAKKKWNGRMFYSITYRAEREEDPKNGWMFIDGGTFKRVGGCYIASALLNETGLCTGSSAPCGEFGRYQELHDKLKKKKDWPEHFYTIE